MSSSYFTFDHDYPSKSWSHRSNAAPVQLSSLDITVEEWGKFYEEAQATAERSKIRKDLLDVQINNIKKEFTQNKSYVVTDKQNEEIKKLQEETKADWHKLSQLAELYFKQAQVEPSSKTRKIEHIDKDQNLTLFQKTIVEYFGLKFLIFNQNYEKYVGRKVLFYYDDNRQSWSLPRSPMPKELLDLGITTKDWFEFYDYATGVKERALLRHKENERHTRNIRVLKNIARGNTYESLSDEVNNKSPPLARIQKLEQVKKDNNQNTMKGWIVLQLKVKNTWMGNKGVYVAPLLRGKVNECYGLTLHTDPNYKPSQQELINEEFLQEQLVKQQQEQEIRKKKEEVAKKIAPPPKRESKTMPSLSTAIAGSFFLPQGVEGNMYGDADDDVKQHEEEETVKRASIKDQAQTIDSASTASAAAFFLKGSGTVYDNDEDVPQKDDGSNKDLKEKLSDDSCRAIDEEGGGWLAQPTSMFLKTDDAGNIYNADDDEDEEDDEDVKAPPASAFLGNISAQPPTAAFLQQELGNENDNPYDDDVKENKSGVSTSSSKTADGREEGAPIVTEGLKEVVQQ